MNQWVLLITLFIAVVIAIWAVLINVVMVRDCPSTLSSDYYACTGDTDCIFNPKYECINSSRELNCIIREDLSARQVAESALVCECINNTCTAVANLP